MNKNGVIDVEDFASMPRAKLHKDILAAVERGDSKWIAENFMSLPAGWFTAHFKLGPTSDIIEKVPKTMPIHIFHGTYDLNCPVQGVYDAEKKLKALGYDKLVTHIFPGYEHSLGFYLWLTQGTHPEPYVTIFETAEGL